MRLRGPRFKPRPRQFCFIRTPCSASETTTSGTKASPIHAWELTIGKWMVNRMDVDRPTSVVKKKHKWNPMACEKWMEKHLDMEGRRKGKRQWTTTRAVAQDTRASPNSQETHLVRKWGDIGLQRTVDPRIIAYSHKSINNMCFVTLDHWLLL